MSLDCPLAAFHYHPPSHCCQLLKKLISPVLLSGLFDQFTYVYTFADSSCSMVPILHTFRRTSSLPVPLYCLHPWSNWSNLHISLFVSLLIYLSFNPTCHLKREQVQIPANQPHLSFPSPSFSFSSSSSPSSSSSSSFNPSFSLSNSLCPSLLLTFYIFTALFSSSLTLFSISFPFVSL